MRHLTLNRLPAFLPRIVSLGLYSRFTNQPRPTREVNHRHDHDTVVALTA